MMKEILLINSGILCYTETAPYLGGSCMITTGSLYQPRDHPTSSSLGDANADFLSRWQLKNQMKTMVGIIELNVLTNSLLSCIYISHTIHVWYIYLHSVDFYDECG